MKPLKMAAMYINRTSLFIKDEGLGIYLQVVSPYDTIQKKEPIRQPFS
jgi:hypothetical protein